MPRYSNWDVVFIPEDDIRTMFDEGSYCELAAVGVFTTFYAYNKHHHPCTEDLPHCTMSQRLGFRDGDGKTVAEAHRFLKPDGEIGGSGLLDPKVIFDHNTHTVYQLHRA